MQQRKVGRLVSIGQRITDRVLRLVRDEAIVPIAPDYLGLFSAQSRIDPDVFNR